MILEENCRVVSQKVIADSIYELILEGKLVDEMDEPGQFVHIKVVESSDPLLRRPISISEIDKIKGQFTIVYRAEGKGTSLLARKQAGDEVNVLGPLGRGFPLSEVEKGSKVLIVGGGVGTPPLLELAKQVTQRGAEVVQVFGFEKEQAVFYEKEFSQYGEVFLATVDGSAGRKGFVTDVIADFNKSDFDLIFSCGPTPMLNALQSVFTGQKLYVSLEQRMGCGIGACFACVCETKNNDQETYKKICSDGPVFSAEEVVIK